MHSDFESIELIDLVAEQSLSMKRIVTREKHGDDISISWVEIDGRHRRMKTDRSTRVYYFIRGEAEFQIGDGAPFDVGPRDAVVIPRGIAYEFTGNLEYLVINSPALHHGDDIVVDPAL